MAHAPRTRAMPRIRRTQLDQRFLEFKGNRRSRVVAFCDYSSARARKQTLQRPEERSLGDDRMVIWLRARSEREAVIKSTIDMDDAPAPRGRAERPAVLYFTGLVAMTSPV